MMYKVTVTTIVFICFCLLSVYAQDGDNDWPQDEWTGDANNCNFTSTSPAPRECDPEAHQLHCHDTSYEHIHLCIGETIAIPDKCLQMTCVHFDGNVVMYRGCHNVVPNEGCYMTETDNNLLFPECCPKEVCYESK